ncbi:MAG: sigma-54 dependent transcriptional regulator [Aureliella sp.]
MMHTSKQDSVSVSKETSGQLVLVIDDEPSICWAMQRALTSDGYRVEVAASVDEGLRQIRHEKPALVFLDVRLPGENGVDALPKFIEATSNAPIVIMTAFGDLETAVRAVEQGATDYLTKPFALADISRVCKVNCGALRLGDATELAQRKSASDNTLVGNSAAMQSVFRQIAFFAASDLSVLITGETGTGKELVAAAIHENSKRCDEPYLAVAPVSMNPELIESELFGHVRGAFTGAQADRVGLFEAAERGTVLLDEIGELSLGLQAKLLRVLERGEYCRVGEVKPRCCNVRILAATHCDLQIAVAEGRFREDLYYRLNGMHIHLPPLRERTDDIRLLSDHFLLSCGTDAPGQRITDELAKQLAHLPWRGNVRELKNAVCHAAVLARGRALQLSDFPREQEMTIPTTGLDHAVVQWAERHLQAGVDANDLHSAFWKAAEPSLLKVALSQAGGSRAKAAELLGIHRGTLRDRLKAYGID